MPAAVTAPAPISWKSRSRPTAFPLRALPCPFLPPFRARRGPWAVFPDAAHRGRGLGRALMDFLELEARRRGYACLALQVWEFNQAAQAFYARIGYRLRSHILEKPL